MELSKELKERYGKGYSIRNLYILYPILQTLSAELSWSQYVLLIRIEDESKRKFYEIETIKNIRRLLQVPRNLGL